MAGRVEELFDMLYSMIEDAKNVPLSGDKCIVERDQALDLLDEIRGQFPVELAEAQKLIANRNDYIASARREADLIRQQAEEKAKQMIAENQVLNAAKARSNEMLKQAEDRSRELRKAANDYCNDAMSRAEKALAEAYDEVKKSRIRFQSMANATVSGNQSKVYDVQSEQ